MIDIHCHLLPGIDDGPATLDASLALARALVDDGITHVVCTPHVFPGRFENRRSNIAPDFARFAVALAAAQVPLKLAWGGEVRLCPESLELLPLQELPFLGEHQGLNCMLLEMPDGQIPLGADRFVHLLLKHRIRPVLAHPERNRMVMDQPAKLEPLLAAGCVVQLTAGSLVGQFGARAQDTAVELLDRGWVHAVATDAHNLSGRRPRMAEAARWLEAYGGQELAQRLTLFGPAELCSGNVRVNNVPPGRETVTAGPVREY